MTKRTLAAAAVLATGAAFPLAGIAAAQADDRDCADFATQEEAQAAFEAVPGDPERLDGDDDGIACEVPNGTEPPQQPDQNTTDTTETDETDTTETDGQMPATGSDSGQTPSGGVEAGYGGTAGNEYEVLLPLSVVGGAALAAGGVVVMRRRTGNSG